MREQNSYRNRLAEAFGMENAPTLIARALHKSTMTVTELRCDRPNFGKTAPIPREDAYLVALQLRACHDHDLHSLMFYLPRKALDNMACEVGVPRVGDLRHQPGVSIDDSVVRNLLSSLLPATANPERAHPLFLDHVALALNAHVAHVYGGMSPNGSLPRGGLAPWQERRVKELMSESMQEEVPLSRLAAECGLSVRHFARAFQQSTGVPPHRWLLKHRVDCAREMLSNRAFFTRVFTATFGISPGAWRRENSTATI